MYKSRLRKWNAYRNRKRASPRETADHRRLETSASRSLSADELDTPQHPRQRHDKASRDALDDGEDLFAGMSDMRASVGSQRRLGEMKSQTPTSKRIAASGHLGCLLDTSSSIASDEENTEGSNRANKFTPSDSNDSEMAPDSGVTEESHPNVCPVSRGEFLLRTEAPPLVAHATTWQIQHDPKNVQHWLWDVSSPPDSGAPLETPVSHERYPYIPKMPEIKFEPKTFVKLSIWYCSLRNEGMYDQADAIASEAGQTYAYILFQQHTHALTSLNTVLIMLLLYGRSSEAIELMRRAREAAKTLFPEMHPIILIMEYFMFQAAGKFETMPVSQLAQAYNFFCNGLGQDHPYTLVAGYLLAWRNAADNTDVIGMLHAVQLLCKLQLAADVRLGRYHLLSIAILNTKARVQHALKMLPDAITNMETVLSRMQATHDGNHPYLLDARSRYAAVLFAAYRDDEAESEYVASVLGQAELFGVEAQATQRSLREIGTFFVTTERTESASDFYIKLAAASACHPSSSSGMVIPKAAI